VAASGFRHRWHRQDAADELTPTFRRWDEKGVWRLRSGTGIIPLRLRDLVRRRPTRAGVDVAELLGRRQELEAVDGLLSRAQAGNSSVLVIRGEAGIGKTALVEHAGDTASRSGFRLQTAAGAESETQFAFAGLHQLCAPLLDRAAALPEPQQDALHVAFGQREGAAPDRFLVGLATLNLLAEVAEETPLLCLVDDAQWLDQASAQVLAFVARRVAAEQMVLVFAVRDHSGSEVDPFVELPELRLDGLGEADARTLLAAAVRAPLADDVRDRIVAESRGNPLALLELPRGAQLAGGYELPDALSVPHRVEDSFRRRSATLPAETQMLLLVAAAEPTGDAALLWRAADRLGIVRESAGPAEAAGLLEIGAGVRFPHPLVRSAVYRAASPPDRRRAHGLLGAVTDHHVDPDRRAWHLGQAVLGVDEAVAAELEASAGRARGRGGLSGAAAFLRRAVELTPEPDQRARRALEAAQATYQAGAFQTGLALMNVAAAGPLDPLQRARLRLLRAQTAFYLARDSDAPARFLDAAAALAPLDPALSRETYLQAVDAAILTGGLGDGRSVRDVAEAARAAPPPPGPAGPVDLLLDGLVTTYTQGHVAGAPRLRQAVEAFCANDPSTKVERAGDHRRWLLTAGSIALALYDDEALHVLADRTVRLAREAGALATLYAALLLQVATRMHSGELAHAAELAAEQAEITRVIGALPLRHAQLIVAAWSGNETDFAALFAAAVPVASVHGDTTEVRVAHISHSVLLNGLGDYPAALDAAERASQSDELSLATHPLVEVVEAASRAGQPERAAAALERFSAWANASGTEWALGLAARCRALTSAGAEAETHYREAIERLSRCRMVVHLARAHLVYGEWLRREGRRQDARVQLRTAHRMLSDMGVEAFAARAERELHATGERPRQRAAHDTAELTLQELHVARLVATGATSREVATELFLSPRTIEAHLRSIFRKLEITSRRQLRELPLP
jgi:DNA-binding CsgD family transcriptional regulator